MSKCSTIEPCIPENWGAKLSIAECERVLTSPGAALETHSVVLANGQVHRWYKNAAPNVRALFLGGIRQHGRSTALVFEGEQYTYDDLFERVSHAASVWRDVYGVRKGDKVGICMRNFPEFIFCFWACFLIGAVPVCVNAFVPGKVIAYCLTMTQCKLIVLDAERAERLEPFIPAIKTEAGALEVLVVRGYEGVASKNDPLAHLKTTWQGTRNWEDVMARHRDVGVTQSWQHEPEADADDDGIILFTSGTTGLPKGVLHGQRTILAAPFFPMHQGRAKLRRGEPLGPAATQRAALLVVPLFHVTGLLSVCVGMFSVGGKLCLIRKWNVEEAVDIIERENVTLAGGVPSIAMDLLNCRKFLRSKNALETISYGGAPASPMIARKVQALYGGGRVFNGQGYGLTETGCPTHQLQRDDSHARPRSVGLCQVVNDVMIMDPVTRTSLPPWHVGEIWMRGPNMMKGYYNNPAATKKVLTADGWFNTEDLGYKDDDGFLYINGRVKDLIIRGGENIDVGGVESAFYDDDRVALCAVVGIPDRRLGELPAAIVTLKEGHEASEDNLLQEVRSKLAKFAVPVMVIVEDAPLALNAAGKILKEPLKLKAKQAWEQRKREFADHSVKAQL